MRLFGVALLALAAGLAPVGATAADTKPPGCPIKGNVSKSGERIYHLPGDKHYAQTKIETAKGERWFCTEDEAVKAGFRHSKR